MTDSAATSDAAPLLHVRDVYKSFLKGQGRIEVLRGASLSIAAGEMVSIVGASGAGKSTLLHIMGTLEAPERGEVMYRNTSLSRMDAAALADFRNQHLGFVFQFHHLLSEFSALENVAMPALIRRWSRTQAFAAARTALEEVGLSKRIAHRPGELSGGEQQRVALARALVLDPPLLLADEVTGNLDEKTGEEIHQLLFELNEARQVTMVVVTHNRSLAERMPRRLILEDGLVKERT